MVLTLYKVVLVVFRAQTMCFCMEFSTPPRSRHFFIIQIQIKQLKICTSDASYFTYEIMNETNVHCKNYADISLFGVMNAVSWDPSTYRNIDID